MIIFNCYFFLKKKKKVIFYYCTDCSLYSYFRTLKFFKKQNMKYFYSFCVYSKLYHSETYTELSLCLENPVWNLYVVWKTDLKIAKMHEINHFFGFFSHHLLLREKFKEPVLFPQQFIVKLKIVFTAFCF